MGTSIESQGVQIKLGNGASPEVFTAIPNVQNFEGPGGAASVIDISDLDSTAREKRMGLPDEGQFSFQVKHDGDQVQLTTLRTARKNRTQKNFQVVYTDGSPATTDSFAGYVLEYRIRGGVDEVVMADVTVEIDGAVTTT